ncbi:MAG: hypothetical protein J7M24_05575, partial [Candidatus Latescibacteria bacterium]|nr:hypothetical protein [Candidatus Latescibacterota bacterium]
RTALAQAKQEAKDKASGTEPATAVEPKLSGDVTPLPPAIYSIITEKPVKNMPGERNPAWAAENKEVSRLIDEAGGVKALYSTGADSTVAPGAPSGVPPDIQEQLKKQEQAKGGETAAYYMEELNLLNVPTANLRTMKFVIDDLYRLNGMAYGEEQGYVRILEADSDGNFSEVWKSPPTNSPIRGVFVDDLDGNKSTEIVAYTADGNFFIYGYESHDLLYRTPEGTYQNINCMAIFDIDSDPQKELIFIGVKPGAGGDSAGNLIQFDPVSQFEEWSSTDLYTATDMLIGNVDTDPDAEIIFNTGEILNSRFKNVEWKSTIQLGSRLYLIDMDSDGILELVTEYGESFIKIIDVDKRTEKW